MAKAIRPELNTELETALKKILLCLCAICLATSFAGGDKGDAAVNASGTNSLDKYAAQITLKVKRNFRGAPEWRGHYYSTTTHVEIDKGGRVLGVNVKKSSGNRDFDKAVVVAIKRTGNFGAPPMEGLRVVGLRFDTKILKKS